MEGIVTPFSPETRGASLDLIDGLDDVSTLPRQPRLGGLRILELPDLFFSGSSQHQQLATSVWCTATRPGHRMRSLTRR